MMKDCLEECEAEVLIDPNSFSDDGTFSLGGTSISPDASRYKRTTKINVS